VQAIQCSGPVEGIAFHAPTRTALALTLPNEIVISNTVSNDMTSIYGDSLNINTNNKMKV
jgi:hypothetical protein